MTPTQSRPTLRSSCAQATTAAEARYRIDAPIAANRTSRIIALDGGADGIVGELADRTWSPGARFLFYEASTSVDGPDALQADARLRDADGTQVLLGDELTDADVAVMVATVDEGSEAASVIGHACFTRGIMTAGLVVAEGGAADRAVAALRPHAMVLVATSYADDVPEMLTALRV